MDKIKLFYEDSKISLCADPKHLNVEVYKDVAMAMLRQMNKTKKGRVQLEQIGTILNCWKLENEH